MLFILGSLSLFILVLVALDLFCSLLLCASFGLLAFFRLREGKWSLLALLSLFLVFTMLFFNLNWGLLRGFNNFSLIFLGFFVLSRGFDFLMLWFFLLLGLRHHFLSRLSSLYDLLWSLLLLSILIQTIWSFLLNLRWSLLLTEVWWIEWFDYFDCLFGVLVFRLLHNFFNDTLWLLFRLSEETGEFEEGIWSLEPFLSREEGLQLVHAVQWDRLLNDEGFWLWQSSLGDFVF